MAVTADKPVPYAPTAAVLGVIERYRDHGMQKPFTGDVLIRVGISDSLIPRTLQALQILELIDDGGNPTEKLEGLRLATEDEYKERLAEWIRAVYADVFSFVDPSTARTSAVRDAFRSYNPQSQQARMVTLFLGLCKASGIVEKASPEKPRRVRTKLIQPITPRKKQTHRETKIKSGLPPALTGLLDSLPQQGKTWTQEQRDDFVNTFGVVLDYSFPISEQKDPETKEHPQ